MSFLLRNLVTVNIYNLWSRWKCSTAWSKVTAAQTAARCSDTALLAGWQEGCPVGQKSQHNNFNKFTFTGPCQKWSSARKLISCRKIKHTSTFIKNYLWSTFPSKTELNVAYTKVYPSQKFCENLQILSDDVNWQTNRWTCQRLQGGNKNKTETTDRKQTNTRCV